MLIGMARWQHALFLVIDGEHLPLALDEAQEVIDELRRVDRGSPEMLDAEISAAIHLERLVDELGAQNPPLTDRETTAIGLALTRIEVTSGLTERQQSLRDAILARDLRRAAENE